MQPLSPLFLTIVFIVSLDPLTITEAASAATTATSSSADPSQDMYCGSSWLDAFQNCHEPCPSGEDGDCSRDDWRCFLFTGCADKEAFVSKAEADESTRNSGSNSSSSSLEESFRYCGSTWLDAALTCSAPCPGGDGDCSDGYSCFAVTTCKENGNNGSGISNSDGDGANEKEDDIQPLLSEVVLSLLGIEQLMGNFETGLLEETVFDFLAEAMHNSPIDLKNAKVAHQRTATITTTDDEDTNNGRRRRLPTSSSALEVNLVVTGEYRPPPYLDMDAIVSDSINRDSSRIVKDLRERGSRTEQGSTPTTNFFDRLQELKATSASETTRSPTASVPVPGPTSFPSQQPTASISPSTPTAEAALENDANNDNNDSTDQEKPWQSEGFAAHDNNSKNDNSPQQEENEEEKGGRHDKYSTASGIAVYNVDDDTSNPDHQDEVGVEEENEVVQESTNKGSQDGTEAGNLHANETATTTPIPSKEQGDNNNISDEGTISEKNDDGNNEQVRDHGVKHDSTQSESNPESSNSGFDNDSNGDSGDDSLLETNFILTLQNVPETNMNEREILKYQQILHQYLLQQRALSKSNVEVLNVQVHHQLISSAKKVKEAEKIMKGGKIKTNSVSSTKKYRAKSRNLKVLADRVSYNDESLPSLSSREDIEVTTTIQSTNPYLPPYVASILILNRIAAPNATILQEFRSEQFYSYFKNVDGISVRLIDQVTAEPTWAPTTYEHFLSVQDDMGTGAKDDASSNVNIYVATGLGIAAMWCLLTIVSLLHLRRARNEMRNERTLHSSRKIMEDGLEAGKPDTWETLDGSEVTKSMSFVSEVTDEEYGSSRHINDQHDIENGINGTGDGSNDTAAIPKCNEENLSLCPTRTGRSRKLNLLLDQKMHAKSQRLLHIQKSDDSDSTSDNETGNADQPFGLSTALLPPKSSVSSSLMRMDVELGQGRDSSGTLALSSSKPIEAKFANSQPPFDSEGQAASHSLNTKRKNTQRSTSSRSLTSWQDHRRALPARAKSYRALTANHESEKSFISISNRSGSSCDNSKKRGSSRSKSLDSSNNHHHPRRNHHRSSDRSRKMKNNVRKLPSSRSRSLTTQGSRRSELPRTSSSLNSERKPAAALLDDNIFQSLARTTSTDCELEVSVFKERNVKSHNFVKSEKDLAIGNTQRRMRSYSADFFDDKHRRRRKNRNSDSKLNSPYSNSGKVGKKYVPRSASHRTLRLTII